MRLAATTLIDKFVKQHHLTRCDAINWKMDKARGFGAIAACIKHLLRGLKTLERLLPYRR